jgi:hypothetical protein
MKLKKFLIYGLLLAMVAGSSCSNDESGTSKAQFSFDGETISLQGANLYLTYDGEVDEHIYRSYFISDGTYTNGDGNEGHTFGDYENATYFLQIILAVPEENQFETGNYPQLNDWDNADDNSNFSYISLLTNEGDTEYYTDDTNNDDSPAEITGGVNGGEEMNIKFSGKLTVFKVEDGGFSEKTVSGKFSFSGTVQEKRDPK